MATDRHTANQPGDRDNAAPVALVTGCSSGIGAALVAELLRVGYRVVQSARRPQQLDVDGSRSIAVPLDVTSAESISRAVATVVGWSGRIDLLVNNAGYGLIGPLLELQPEQLRQQLETNLVGAFAVIQSVAPHMIARGSGTIVNIGSISGLTVTPYSGAYCASKAALHRMDDALRMELAPFGISVVTVQPGAIISRFSEQASQGIERYRSEGSRYRAVASFIERRAQLSQQRATPAEALAAVVVRKVSRRRPPALIRYGRGSWLLPAIGRLPIRLRDRLFSRRFGLDRL